MTERGRSLTEMLGTLAIVGILSVVGIWGYKHIVNSHETNTILHDINMMAHTCAAQLVMMDRTECALSDFSNKIDDKYPVSAQRVNQDYFKLVVSNIPQSICQELLNKGMPLASQIIPFTCVETNQFEWTFHKNLEGAVSTKFCRSDLDCNVCGVCQIADGQSQGICIGSCATPAHACETNEDCNTENECMVCDTESNMCKNGCERVEYLESSGTQYIDTGIYGTEDLETELICQQLQRNASSNGKGIFGAFTSTSANSYYLYQQGEAISHWQVGFGSYLNTSTEIDLNKHTFNFSNYKVYMDGTEIASLNTGSMNTTPYTLLLFNTHRNNGTLYDALPQRFYSVKFIRNGVLVRDYIPVHVELKTDGRQNCMFDKVSKKLFCSKTNTDFIVP